MSLVIENCRNKGRGDCVASLHVQLSVRHSRGCCKVDEVFGKATGD